MPSERAWSRPLTGRRNRSSSQKPRINDGPRLNAKSCHADRSKRDSAAAIPEQRTAQRPKMAEIFPAREKRMEVMSSGPGTAFQNDPVSYTHLRAHETPEH